MAMYEDAVSESMRKCVKVSAGILSSNVKPGSEGTPRCAISIAAIENPRVLGNVSIELMSPRSGRLPRASGNMVGSELALIVSFSLA